MRSLTLQLLGLPILYLLFLSPQMFFSRSEMALGIQISLIFLGSLALVFGGVHAFSKDDSSLWNYGIYLFSRAVIALSLSFILAAGISLALLSIETLFTWYWLDSGDYATIWGFFMLFVANFSFLVSIPHLKEVGNLQAPLSRGIKTFSHFIAFPLLAIYATILFFYVGKILLFWDLPNGFVAMPVLLFSLFGFFNYGILFPLREDRQNKAIMLFSKFFPWTVLPFMTLYFIALGQRISQYGITEHRYLGIALGLLLIGFALYFALNRKAKLKIIPLTLFLGSFLINVGPWSVFSVSENSQVNRLEKLLIANDLLVNGEIQPLAEQEVALEDQDQISSILHYLSLNHDFEKISPWFKGKNVTQMFEYDVMKELGFENDYYYNGYSDQGFRVFSFNADHQEPIDISGYDFSLEHYWYLYGDSSIVKNLTLDGEEQSLTLDFDEDSGTEFVTLNGETVEMNFNAFVKDLRANHLEMDSLLDAEKLSISGETDGFRVKIYFRNLNLKEKVGLPEFTDASGIILIDAK